MKRYIRSLGFLSSLMLMGQTIIFAQENTTDKVLSKAKQGAVVSIPEVFKMKTLDLKYKKKVVGNVQLLMSDDPEYISDTAGIALDEPVKAGTVRLYLYNVNGVVAPKKMPRRIAAVLKNTGNANMHFQMKRSATLPPSENYYDIGKMGLANFFTSKKGTVKVIKPGESIILDPTLTKQVANYNELVHGLYEFTIDQPGEVKVLQYHPDIDEQAAIKTIRNMSASNSVNAGRGSFSPADYQVNVLDIVDTKAGVARLILADGKTDTWVKGVEYRTQRNIELAGNYGVMYDITIPWKSSDGKGLALVTWNPMSGVGQWCDGMANAMVVSNGKFKEGVVLLPSDTVAVKKSPNAIFVQYFPGQKGVQYIHLKYSPPGASCLPTPLLLVPVKGN